jgi:proteasome accessory factor B
VSRKSERLVNLTIALLATKRFITKSEIFRTVDGYEGSPETKERMFERDKDDLRNLGIEIEVGSFDPLFDDEAGYRIRPESYALNLDDISGEELGLLSLAAEAWRGAALDDAAQSALLRLSSIGVVSDIDSLPAMTPRLSSSHISLETLTTAITARGPVTFNYIAAELSIEERVVDPYGIATRNGHWYLVGFDHKREGIRIFRFDRIDGDISKASKGKNYEIPADFDLAAQLSGADALHESLLDIRKGKAHVLRHMAFAIQDMGEWDQIRISYPDVERMIKLVLWHGADVKVVSHDSLRNGVIDALRELVAIHG